MPEEDLAALIERLRRELSDPGPVGEEIPTPRFSLVEAVREVLEPRRTRRAILSLFSQSRGLNDQDLRLLQLCDSALRQIIELRMEVSALTDTVAELRRGTT